MEKHYNLGNKQLFNELITDVIDKSYQIKVQNNFDDNNNFVWNKSYSDDGLSIVLKRFSIEDKILISHRFSGDLKTMRYYVEIIITNRKDIITINTSDKYLNYFIKKYELELI